MAKHFLSFIAIIFIAYNTFSKSHRREGNIFRVISNYDAAKKWASKKFVFQVLRMVLVAKRYATYSFSTYIYSCIYFILIFKRGTGLI